MRGRFRNKITIERFTRADDFTDNSGSWATHIIRWAEYKPEKINSKFGDQTIEGVTSARFVCEDASTVVEGDRVSWNSRKWTIVAAREVDQIRKWYELEVKQIDGTA